MRPGCFAALLAAELLVLGAPSHAEPSIWYRAAHPRAATEARLLRGLERMLDNAEQAQADPEASTRFARAAVAMLDLVRVPAPEDPRLACAMANALLSADLGRAAEAERLLERAIKSLPEGSLLARAFRELGRARAQQKNPAGARDALSRSLDLEVEPHERAVVRYERAVAEVRLGELRPAAHDYELAAAAASNELLRARARYGLAVTLERSGDLPGAYAVLEQVAAVSLPLSRYPSADPLELRGGFDPPYELSYVKALAALARARRAEDTRARRNAYEQASAELDAYLFAAPPSELWVENARALRARAHAELRKLPAPKR